MHQFNRSLYVVDSCQRITTRFIFRNLFILLACQLKIIRVVLQLQYNNSSTPDWTMAKACSLVSQFTSCGDYSLFLMRQRGLSFISDAPITSDHMSDALICLLRVPERVEFKIAVLTHKVICGVAPRYLGPLSRVTDISGRRSLRSSGTNRLVVPPFRLSTVGNRAFPVAAAKTWNALPGNLV